MINGEQVTGFIKGLGAIIGINLLDIVPGLDLETIIKLGIQVLVGIGTIWHMWKTRNNKQS
jgi:hypothetical protein